MSRFGKLMRVPGSERMIFGVCGGMANRMGVHVDSFRFLCWLLLMTQPIPTLCAFFIINLLTPMYDRRYDKHRVREGK